MDVADGVVQIGMPPCPLIRVVDGAVMTALRTLGWLTVESRGYVGDFDLVLDTGFDVLEPPFPDIDAQQELEEPLRGHALAVYGLVDGIFLTLLVFVPAVLYAMGRRRFKTVNIATESDFYTDGYGTI